jgi:hypothetical protein
MSTSCPQQYLRSVGLSGWHATFAEFLPSTASGASSLTVERLQAATAGDLRQMGAAAGLQMDDATVHKVLRALRSQAMVRSPRVSVGAGGSRPLAAAARSAGTPPAGATAGLRHRAQVLDTPSPVTTTAKHRSKRVRRRRHSVLSGCSYLALAHDDSPGQLRVHCPWRDSGSCSDCRVLTPLQAAQLRLAFALGLLPHNSTAISHESPLDLLDIDVAEHIGERMRPGDADAVGEWCGKLPVVPISLGLVLCLSRACLGRSSLSSFKREN